MTDTQVLALHYPDVFESMTRWAADTRETYNTLAVLHTGDIVDNPTGKTQWERAARAVSLLGDLSFYCVTGNHDVRGNASAYKWYRHFDLCDARDPELRFREGRCWAQPFSAGGTDFLLLGIGWREKRASFVWASEIMSAHPDRSVILLVHHFLSDNGELSVDGKLVVERLAENFPQIRLILSGHMRGAARRELTHGDGSVTHAMLHNFQEENKQKCALGYLRLLTFDPVTREISVTTYSPWLDQYLLDEEHTFIIPNAF